MAEIPYTVENVDGNVRVVTWGTDAAPMQNGDVGRPYTGANFSDCGYHLWGTYGVGGTVQIQGTDETALAPAHWEVTVNPAYEDLTLTSAKRKKDVILTRSIQMRPEVTAGDGDTAFVVKLVFTSVAQRWRAPE